MNNKRKLFMLLSVLTGLAMFLISLHLRTTERGWIPVGQEAENLLCFFKLWTARLFKNPYWLQHDTIVQNQPLYIETVGRLKSSLLTAICGAAVAAAGAVYQFVFRNDLASPSMLGVSSGVNLAIFLFVLKYSVDALNRTGLGYVYCYTATFLILLLVILSGRFSEDRKGNGKVVMMLLCGCVISQIASSIVSSGTNILKQDDYAVYLMIASSGWGISSFLELAVFIVTLMVGFLPVFFLKNRMDLLSFSDEECQTIGIHSQRIRLVSLVAGSMLVTASTIACSNVGIMAILMPHLSRFLFGVRFRDITTSCMIYGASFLLICRMISSWFSFGSFSLVFTLSSVTGLLATPFVFLIMIMRGRHMEQ